MKKEDGFKTISSMTLEGGNSARVKFPVPEGMESIVLSMENIELATEYYLLARYAFLHKMQSAFMINSFWTIEHLILSVLVYKYKTKKDLSNKFDFHNINKYWDEAKKMFPKEAVKNADKLDDYIGKIKGYFGERYPKNVTKTKLIHTGKNPKVSEYDKKEKGNFVKFNKVYSLDLDEMDYFVSFMLCDVVKYQPLNFQGKLLWYDSTDLYTTKNEHSMIYPNRKYPKIE